jgi:hypothetical protein
MRGMTLELAATVFLARAIHTHYGMQGRPNWRGRPSIARAGVVTSVSTPAAPAKKETP